MVAVYSPTVHRPGFATRAAILTSPAMVWSAARGRMNPPPSRALVDLSLLVAPEYPLHLADVPAVPDQPLRAHRAAQPV